MSERWMAEIVRHSGTFHNIGVDCCLTFGMVSEESLGKPSRNLSDFKAVGQTIVKNKPLQGAHNLRYVRETAKGQRVKDAVPVSLARCSLVSSARSSRRSIFPSRRRCSVCHLMAAAPFAGAAA